MIASVSRAIRSSSDFAISRSGSLFASRTKKQEATVWQLSSGKSKVISTRTAKPDQAMTVYVMAFSEDESQLFLLGERSSVGKQMQVFDLKSGELVKRYVLRPADIFPMSKDTYEGSVVERVPDSDGWSLYGRTFLNSETGEVIEGNKGKLNNVRFRKFIARRIRLTCEPKARNPCSKHLGCPGSRALTQKKPRHQANQAGQSFGQIVPRREPGNQRTGNSWKAKWSVTTTTESSSGQSKAEGKSVCRGES